jgi:cyanate permease
MLCLAWLVYFYFGLMAFSLAPILTRLESELKFGNAAGGALLGAYPLAYVFAALKVGKLCDRFGVKRSVIVGLLLISASALLRAPAGAFWQLFLAALLLGVGGPVVSTVLPKLIAEWFHGPRRTMATGIYVTGPNLGGAVALGLTGVFITVLGSWRQLYLVYAGCGIILLAVWCLLAVEAPAPPPQATDAAAPAARPVWRSAAVWKVVIAGVATFVMTQGFVAWVPTILVSQGFGSGQAAFWAGTSRGATVLGNIVITLVVARFAMSRPGMRRQAVVLILIVCSLCVEACALADHPVTVIALIVQSALAGAMLPLLVAILLDLPDLLPGQSATAAGLYFTVGQLAAATSPILIGWLRDATGGFAVGIAVVAASSLATVPAALRITDASKEPPVLLPPARRAAT